MHATAIFGLGFTMSLVAGGVVTKLYILPLLRNCSREDALVALVIPHAFRFIDRSYLVPGVVSPSLESAFAYRRPMAISGPNFWH